MYVKFNLYLLNIILKSIIFLLYIKEKSFLIQYLFEKYDFLKVNALYFSFLMNDFKTAYILQLLYFIDQLFFKIQT